MALRHATKPLRFWLTGGLGKGFYVGGKTRRSGLFPTTDGHWSLRFRLVRFSVLNVLLRVCRYHVIVERSLIGQKALCAWEFLAIPTRVIALLCLTACEKPVEKIPEQPYIARVQGRIIREVDVLEEFERRGERVNAGSEQSSLRASLERLIRTESLYAKAVAAGYDRRPDIQSQFKRLVISKFEEEEAQKRAAVGKVSAEAIKTHYEAHRGDYTSEEKARVSVLYVKVSPKAEPEKVADARARVEALRTRAIEETMNLADFGLLAQEHSDDQTTRYRGGDCGFITRQSSNVRWEASLRDAAFSLNRVGEISPVIKASDGFYLFKLMERRAAEVAPLSAVSARIERELSERLRRESRAAFDEEVKRGLQIEIDEAAFRAIRPPSTPARSATSQPPQGPTQ